MKLRIALAASALWALSAVPAGAVFYEMNRAPYNIDLVDSNSMSTGADQIRTVNVGRAAWDNRVDLMVYEIDCAGGQRARLMQTMHFINKTNGLDPTTATENGGDWMPKDKAKQAKRYIDFVCNYPDSTKHYLKIDGDTLAAASHKVALDLAAGQAAISGDGDDRARAMSGRY